MGTAPVCTGDGEMSFVFCICAPPTTVIGLSSRMRILPLPIWIKAQSVLSELTKIPPPVRLMRGFAMEPE